MDEVIEFSPIRCFSEFVEKCLSARRQADVDSDLALQGDTYKTLINSAYVSTLLNKEKFSNTSYIKGHSSFKLVVNSQNFRKATPLDDEMYEIVSAKGAITMDIPIQIGFFILNYAKLRMLEFYYDCLCKYIDRSKFECVQMDTDSLYFVLAAKNLCDAVKDHLRSEFVEKLEGRCGHLHSADVETFFPRTCCRRDILFDKRGEGLFKEMTGSEMVTVLAEKYRVCQKFREALHAVESAEIIYASKERLACGMEYSFAVLTDSSRLPGCNMLGESLSALKKENQA